MLRIHADKSCFLRVKSRIGLPQPNFANTVLLRAGSFTSHSLLPLSYRIRRSRRRRHPSPNPDYIAITTVTTIHLTHLRMKRSQHILVL